MTITGAGRGLGVAEGFALLTEGRLDDGRPAGGWDVVGLLEPAVEVGLGWRLGTR
jgi:hypothetical protein